jgi:S1-C subfamily serine protease
MKFPFLSSALALLVLVTPAGNLAAVTHEKKAGPASASSGPFAWENAIIHIEVTSKLYNYIQPWEREEHQIYKSGVVVDGHLILTTAEGLADQTVIRLKKQGDGVFSYAKVAWIDYQADVAALTTDDALNAKLNPTAPDFWIGLQPAKLADPVPTSGSVRVLRWRDDSLENRQGEIERLAVDNSVLSFVSVPALKIDSNIQGAGFGEAVTVGDKLIGLASAQGGDALTAIPTSFIAPIVKAEAEGKYTGIGYFDFTWDPVENPLNLDYLKLTGPARGVIIKETGLKPGVTSLVHSRDVLLQIDGFDIDSDGNYHDPQYKKLSLENLSSRGKWAGMTCKFKILRDGKEMDLVYTLPKASYADELVPSQSFDQAPEYVIVGGLIFTPLTGAYLRSWGPAWRQRSPFRLSYYTSGKVTAERPQRVILTQILPAPSNIGYEALRNLVIDEINGMKIKTIADIPVALKSPIDGFDVFRFEGGESVRQVVLDANELDQVNQQILAHYHNIPSDHVIHAESVTQ